MYMYMHMYSGILIDTYRNWRHLRTDVKKAEHQLEIYYTLNVLMKKLDERKFQGVARCIHCSLEDIRTKVFCILPSNLCFLSR